MMARPASIADHYRAHREAFLLARELGVTPKEASRELARRKAWQQLEETQRRAAAQAKASPAPATFAEPAEPEEDNRYWWKRD